MGWGPKSLRQQVTSSGYLRTGEVMEKQIHTLMKKQCSMTHHEASVSLFLSLGLLRGRDFRVRANLWYILYRGAKPLRSTPSL
jgi:hypothetical protein